MNDGLNFPARHSNTDRSLEEKVDVISFGIVQIHRTLSDICFMLEEIADHTGIPRDKKEASDERANLTK